MSFTVWITRPKESSIATIQKVSALGFKYINIPLLKLQTQHLDINYSAYHIIIVTSMHAAAVLARSQTTAKIAVVGNKTAATLTNVGKKIWRTYADIAALIADANTWPAASVLYLRGKNITHDLQPFMGEQYSEQVVYSMAPVTITSTEALLIKQANCVLVYSKRSGYMIAKTLKKYDIDASKMHFICISRHAAYSLQEFTPLIAKRPDEEAMMQILQTLIYSPK